eukprot:Gb_02456 [translate_table: standard]
MAMAAGLSERRLLIGAVVVMMIAAADVEAQSAPAPSYPPSSCTIYRTNLSSCVNYIENINSGSLTPPPQSCCTALDSVFNTTVCLCQLFSDFDNPLGFPLNQTQALALEYACNIKTPSLSILCKAISSGPSTAPVASSGSSTAASGSTE